MVKCDVMRQSCYHMGGGGGAGCMLTSSLSLCYKKKFNNNFKKKTLKRIRITNLQVLYRVPQQLHLLVPPLHIRIDGFHSVKMCLVELLEI